MLGALESQSRPINIREICFDTLSQLCQLKFAPYSGHSDLIDSFFVKMEAARHEIELQCYSSSAESAQSAISIMPILGELNKIFQEALQRNSKKLTGIIKCFVTALQPMLGQDESVEDMFSVDNYQGSFFTWIYAQVRQDSSQQIDVCIGQILDLLSQIDPNASRKISVDYKFLKREIDIRRHARSLVYA